MPFWIPAYAGMTVAGRREGRQGAAGLPAAPPAVSSPYLRRRTSFSQVARQVRDLRACRVKLLGKGF